MRFPYRGSGACFTNGTSVFLGLRAKKPFKGRWGFPGGGYEKKDLDDLETAKRETLEETGISISELSNKLTFLGKNSYVFPFFRWNTFFYFTDLDFDQTYLSEFYEVKWVSMTDVLERKIKCNPLLVNEVRILKKLLRKIEIEKEKR